MKRDFLVLSILLLLIGTVWQAPKAYHYYEARRFWNEFLAVNSAWLTPNPPAMSYKTTCSPQGDEFPATVQTWYSPGDSVRILSMAAYRKIDIRYANGKGAVEHYEKRGFTPRLTMEDRITAQTGLPFVTALHVFAEKGLPWKTTMEDTGNTVVLRWHGYREGDGWFDTSEDYDMELVFDRQTKLPIRLEEYHEYVDGGAEVDTRFGGWLKVNGKPVPGFLESGNWDKQVNYAFQVVRGVWIGKDMVCKYAYGTGPRTEKAVISNIKIGPVPKSMFVGKEVGVPRSTRWHGTPSSRLWNTTGPTPRLDTGKRVGDSMLERFYSDRDGRPEVPGLPQP